MTTATLQADIAAWMNRTDLTTQIPGFIRIAESRIALDVRSWQMIVALTLTQPADGVTSSIPVPLDWLEWDALWISGRPLDYVQPEVMAQFIRAGNTASIAKYTMVGGKLIVGATIPTTSPAVAVATTYYQHVTPLVASGDTNWLLDTYPALYLYASLASACRFVKDDQRAAGYSDNYVNLLTDINSNATKAPKSGSQWRQRAR